MTKNRVQEQIYDLVRQIPIGSVVTYGDIAKVVRVHPRYVGFVLHNNPYRGDVPCHRVVNSQGKVATTFAFGGGQQQMNILLKEGVSLHNGRICLSSFRHLF